MKVYIEYSSAQYRKLFEEHGYKIVATPVEADIVCFTGGADVTPTFYGATTHKYTHHDYYRDVKEEHLFNFCRERNIAMAGICRGGQILNVFCGGSMYQHVSGHTSPHSIIDMKTGETIHVSSTHHQMMKPASLGDIVAIADIPSTREWYDGIMFMRDENNTGIEVVHYKEQRCLCFQPHPEFDSKSRMAEYFFEQIKEKLF